MDPRKSLGRLGLDSLMAVELRNRIESSLALRLPISSIWNFPSLEALVPHLAERMGIDLDAPTNGHAPSEIFDNDADDEDEDDAQLAAVLEAATFTEPDVIEPELVPSAAPSEGDGP